MKDFLWYMSMKYKLTVHVVRFVVKICSGIFAQQLFQDLFIDKKPLAKCQSFNLKAKYLSEKGHKVELRLH